MGDKSKKKTPTTSRTAPAKPQVVSPAGKFMGAKIVEPVFRPARTTVRKIDKAVAKTLSKSE